MTTIDHDLSPINIRRLVKVIHSEIEEQAQKYYLQDRTATLYLPGEVLAALELYRAATITHMTLCEKENRSR